MFDEETMHCANCATTQRADPGVASGWVALSVVKARGLVQTLRYLCPACLGKATPRCRRCGRFFDAAYRVCPWCTPLGDLAS
jgi:hypothetical protein